MTKKWLLYAAYTCSCMEDRTYSFFTSIVLESIGGMRFLSIGQFSETVVQMIFGGYLGRILDTTSRKNAIITVVLVNNVSVFFSVFAFLGSIYLPKISMISLYTSIFFCAVNRLFLNSEKMILSKDWVLKIHDGNKLSQQNAILTTLDQFLNVLAPIGVGALLSVYGIPETLLIFGVISIVSFTLKSVLLYLTYQSNESLHYKRQLSDSESHTSESTSHSYSLKAKKPGVLATYFQQKTIFAAIGMALFSKTVMGFDNLAVGYAKSSSNLSIFTIGMIRSYGSLVGMLGVISYTIMEKRIGLINSGFVGLMVQQACSIVAVLTIWIPGSPFLENEGHSILIFLIAIATARYGLWCLDLTITHSMQTQVPESERNTVFGFHTALCQALSVPKELLVIFFPKPSQFYLYILSSYTYVTIGQVLFCIYVRKIHWK